MWAGPFGAAVRRSGGQLVTSGRIPTQALLAAAAYDRGAAAEGEEGEMPLFRERRDLPGLIGRIQDRREDRGDRRDDRQDDREDRRDRRDRRRLLR